MAPLHRAINMNPASAGHYEGVVDPEWTMGSFANGGYLLALIVEACIQFQSTTDHIDPIHITAHYLRATYAALFTICIHSLKTGSGFTNLSAELSQEGTVKIMTHAIFGTNEPHPRDKKLNLNLNPPSTYARRHPLYIHPSKAISKPIRQTWKFHPYCRWLDEPDILVKNEINSPTRTNSSLVFLVDIFLNAPSLLPKSERVGLTTSWHPTAPSNIGEGNVVDNWRDNQVCLATATKMALTLPIQVNEKLGKVKL